MVLSTENRLGVDGGGPGDGIGVAKHSGKKIAKEQAVAVLSSSPSRLNSTVTSPESNSSRFVSNSNSSPQFFSCNLRRRVPGSGCHLRVVGWLI